MGILTEQIRLLNLEQACAAACARVGIEHAMTASSLDGDVDAIVERRPFHNEGSAPRHLTLRQAWDGEAPSAASLARIAEFVAHLRRLHDRDHAIANAGGDVLNPPAWSFMVHPMAIAITRNAGWDPLLLATLDVQREQRTGITTMISSATADVRGASEWDGLACGGYASLTHRTEDWEYKDVAGTVVLWIKRPMPLTLIQSMAGMKVDDIVDDARLRGSGAIVESTIATRDGGEAVLFLEKAYETVAPPPAGIDLSWLVLGGAGTPSL